MKKIVLFIALIFPVLLTGCIHDCITDPPTEGTTITITADLPGGSANSSGNDADMPDTRVALEQNNLDVDLNWEEGDQLDLCIVYGEAKLKLKQTVAVTPDPGNNKKATFSLTLPGGDYTTFDLYGVYGGEGLDAADPTKAKLTTAANSTSSSLEVLHKNKAIMLKFAKTGISKASPNLVVDFEHMGSLFRILLKNTGSVTWNNITSARLTATTNIPAYPNGGSAIYDLVNGTFSGSQGTSLSFSPISSSNIVSGGILALWAWFPVVKGEGEGADWPALNIKVTVDGSDKTTLTAKTGRKATTGKAYHLYAILNGTILVFANSGSMTVADGKLADTRDGNLYNTVAIGPDGSKQTWMKENLAYLPSVNGKATGSEDPGYETGAFYYVYGYDGTDVNTAKGNLNYQTYGVLYNWYAAVAGELCGEDDPIGVQGICPNGWHLPSDKEWKQLETYLEMPEDQLDITGNRGTNEGDQLKETGTSHWHSSYEGVTNSTGFTALPGGSRNSDDTFNFIRYLGYWWTASDNYFDSWYRFLFYSAGYVGRTTSYKEYGYSVRCVKDA